MSEESPTDGAPVSAPPPASAPAPASAPESAGPAAPASTHGDTPSKPGAAWQPSYVFLAIVTLINLVADVGSKQWIKHYFETSHLQHAARKIEIVSGSISLIYATNKGGAWGILQGEHESLRRPFFLVVSVAAIVFIISLYRKLTPGQRALRWGLPLVLGGALGNLIDRIIYGFVIDFIDCFAHKGGALYPVFAAISSLFGGVPGDEIHWPTFNVADIAICVGVGLMAVDMFTSREKSPSGDAAAKKVDGSEETIGPAAAALASPSQTPDSAPPSGEGA